MSDTTKNQVLAKCHELAPKRNNLYQINDSTRLFHGIGSDHKTVFSIAEKRGHSDDCHGTIVLSIRLDDNVPEDHQNWPLAAKILGIEDDQAKADREAILIEFANGLERKLIDSYCTGDAISAIKRLCGMEVGNG